MLNSTATGDGRSDGELQWTEPSRKQSRSKDSCGDDSGEEQSAGPAHPAHDERSNKQHDFAMINHTPIVVNYNSQHSESS